MNQLADKGLEIDLFCQNVIGLVMGLQLRFEGSLLHGNSDCSS